MTTLKQFLKFFFIFLAIAVLPACGPHYKKRSLSYLQQVPPNYAETKDNVTFQITKPTNAHCDVLFDNQGKYLIQAGIQPLYLRIINETNRTFFLTSNEISLKHADPQLVTEALSKGKLPIFGTFLQSTAPITIPTLFFIGCIKATDPSAAFIFAPAALVFIGIGILISPIIIVSTIYSCYQTNKQLNEYNHDLAEDITEKNIPETLKIPADTIQEFLFFADAAQFKNNFDVTFTEKITQKNLTFNVTL